MDLTSLNMNYFWYIMTTVGIISFLGCMYLLGNIKKSVGMDFLRSMMKARMLSLKNDSVIVLRIRDLAGNEQYQTKDVSEFIKYDYKQNNKKIEKGVIYNERAVTIWNGVKILSVSPTSILPIDRDTGLYVNINPELTNKIITDSGKTAESDKSQKEMQKMFLWLAALCIIGTIVAISYFYQNQADLMDKLRLCYEAGTTAATIKIGG